MPDIILESQTINDITRTANDNGFDLEVHTSNPLWLRFKSSSPLIDNSLSIDLSYCSEGYLIAIHNVELLHYIIENVIVSPAFMDEKDKPSEAVDIVSARQLNQLSRVLQTISKFVPSEPLQKYHEKTIHLPESTEEERLVKQRIGQNILRDALLEHEERSCVVTGLDIPELLIASHIKPWRDATDEERLCLDNVLLLAPHLDSLFDKGYISFDDNGRILFSPQITIHCRQILGVHEDMHILRPLSERKRVFLKYHRERVFRK